MKNARFFMPNIVMEPDFEIFVIFTVIKLFE